MKVGTERTSPKRIHKKINTISIGRNVTFAFSGRDVSIRGHLHFLG